MWIQYCALVFSFFKIGMFKVKETTNLDFE